MRHVGEGQGFVGRTMVPHRLVVDHSEGDAPLLRLVRESGLFFVQMDRLPTGDYLIDDRILIEGKSAGVRARRHGATDAAPSPGARRLDAGG